MADPMKIVSLLAQLGDRILAGVIAGQCIGTAIAPADCVSSNGVDPKATPSAATAFDA